MRRMGLDGMGRIRRRRFDQVSCPSFQFVSYLAFGKIRFWLLKGRHRGIVIVFCQTRGLNLLETESESHGGEKIEGLTGKVFGDCDLVRTNWSFAENCEPIFQSPRPY